MKLAKKRTKVWNNTSSSSSSSQSNTSSNIQSSSNKTSSSNTSSTITSTSSTRHFQLPTITQRDIQSAVTAPEPSFSLRAGRKESERSFSYRCCMENCTNNNKTP